VTTRTGAIVSVNETLLELIGGQKEAWQKKSMEAMLPKSCRIFLQTHVWPMLLREHQAREIRLELLGKDEKRVPVFVTCEKAKHDLDDHFVWVLFVSLVRSRYEQQLI
jgi:sigma-B regulation protein RsbU (phosphoserine phosphatase)